MGCYNDGRLVGKWLDREQADTVEMGGLVREWVGDLRNHFGCVVCGSSEFWCYDVENLTSSSEMSVSEFVRLAEREERIAEHREHEGLRVFIDHMGYGVDDDLGEIVSQFEDAYRGSWDSAEKFCEEMAEEAGDLENVPEYLAQSIDWYGVWLSWTRHDYWEEDGHFFRNI
jgi:antirestriction protein